MKKLLSLAFVLMMAIGLIAQQADQCIPEMPKLLVTADCRKTVLSWQHNGENVEEFHIFKDGGHYVVIHKDLREWTDWNIKQGEKHTYCIVAVNKWGKESDADCVSTTVPICPPDCADLEPEYFNGYYTRYFDEEADPPRYRYYVTLEWGLEKGGVGQWELLKVVYNINKENGRVEEAWTHQFHVLNTPYFDGRKTDHVYEDYKIARSKEVHYLLRWRCGPCRNWKYFGANILWIPEK